MLIAVRKDENPEPLKKFPPKPIIFGRSRCEFAREQTSECMCWLLLAQKCFLLAGRLIVVDAVGHFHSCQESVRSFGQGPLFLPEKRLADQSQIIDRLKHYNAANPHARQELLRA